MTCVYIEAIDEIKNRLDTAITGGTFPLTFPQVLINTLSIESFIQIGQRQKVEGNDYLPCINILVNGIRENYDSIGQSSQLFAEIDLILRLVYPCDDPDNANVYYNHTDKTGILYFIAEVLDVIHTKISDSTYDPRLLSNCKKGMGVTVGQIQKIADKFTVDVNITITTKHYTINERFNS